MTRVETRCKVTVYEVNGKETGIDRPPLLLTSHWNDVDRVVLKFDGSAEITVLASDLVSAVEKVRR